MTSTEIEKASGALEITALPLSWMDNKVRLEKNISSDFCSRNYKTGLTAAYGEVSKNTISLSYMSSLHALNESFLFFFWYLVSEDISVCSNVLITFSVWRDLMISSRTPG